MYPIMKRIAFLLLSALALTACKSSNQSETKEINYQNKGHELVAEMVNKVGTYKLLHDRKDVVYTYQYETPDGKKDISTEKYIFAGELSYGLYRQHERTFPEMEGSVEMAYDGKEFWLKNGDTLVTDSAKLDVVRFKRPTNFYWFAMFQKLLNPGLNYEYLGEDKAKGNVYDVVKITFESKNDKPTDIYQIYINKETKLVDHFLFTVVDYNVVEVPFLMELEYEEIDGLLIPTKRRYKKSTWEAEVSDDPWILVNWMDIKFNNGLSPSDFMK